MQKMDNHKIPRKMLLQYLDQHSDVQTSLVRNDSGFDTESDIASRDSNSSSSSITGRPDSPVSPAKSPVRVFQAQETVTNSLVSTDPNFQALHDGVTIQMCLIVLLTLVRDSCKAGSLYLNTNFYQIALGTNWKDATNFLIFEVSVLAWSFAVHPAFKMWQKLRSFLPRVIVDGVFVLAYLAYLFGGTAVTIDVLAVQGTLPRITTLIAGLEQFRLMMKSYSFIRENAYKVLYPWHKDDSSGPAVWYKGQMSPVVGSFRQYCYFLFAPTLLYRDHYPRTKSIKWNAVFVYILQMCVSVWCAVFVMVDILYPSSLRQQDVIHCVMLSLVFGLVSLMLCNIAILHSYMNLSAELTRFADRKFYDAWWACTSFSSFYRKWNLLVHDWIHSYVYMDMRKVFSKRFAVFSTILVSSIVHEYLLALGIGFLLPVVTSLFAGIGVFFYVLKPMSNRRISNLFILTCLSMGTCIIISVLILEYSSRQYCPTENVLWFSPRLLHCYASYNP